MSWDVRLSRRVERYLHGLPPRHRERILHRITALATDPFEDSKWLAGGGGRRSARVGDWRLIYTVDVENSLIEVSRIGPRGDVYKNL